MEIVHNVLAEGYLNFLFVGEAGSGKSEIAVNFAKILKERNDKPVHFFDMDMTKPLFRSRDLCEELQAEGIVFHYEEQFMDAPTLVGGVSRLLKDSECYVVMDVGGDYIGARSVGGFAPFLNRPDTMIYYVINPYRPWSYDIDHIDQVLGAILGVTHIKLEKLRMVSNPNMGPETSAREVLSGHRKLAEMISPFADISFMCLREELYDEVTAEVDIPVMNLHLYLNYPWNE